MIGSPLRPGFALPPPFSGDPILGCAFSGATLERVARLDRGVWSRPHPTYRRAAPEPMHKGEDVQEMGRCAQNGQAQLRAPKAGGPLRRARGY